MRHALCMYGLGTAGPLPSHPPCPCSCQWCSCKQLSLIMSHRCLHCHQLVGPGSMPPGLLILLPVKRYKTTHKFACACENVAFRINVGICFDGLPGPMKQGEGTQELLYDHKVLGRACITSSASNSNSVWTWPHYFFADSCNRQQP